MKRFEKVQRDGKFRQIPPSRGPHLVPSRWIPSRLTPLIRMLYTASILFWLLCFLTLNFKGPEGAAQEGEEDDMNVWEG